MLGNLHVDWIIPIKNKTDTQSRVPQHMAKMWATEGAVAIFLWQRPQFLIFASGF